MAIAGAEIFERTDFFKFQCDGNTKEAKLLEKTAGMGSAQQGFHFRLLENRLLPDGSSNAKGLAFPGQEGHSGHPMDLKDQPVIP